MEHILGSTSPTHPETLTHWFARLRVACRRWQLNIRTRRQLANLDERLLADAGISSSDRFKELNKPFWR